MLAAVAVLRLVSHLADVVDAETDVGSLHRLQVAAERARQRNRNLIRVGAADRDWDDDFHEVVGVERGDFAEVDRDDEVLSRTGTAVDRAAERARDRGQTAGAEIERLRGDGRTGGAQQHDEQQREQAGASGGGVGESLHNRSALQRRTRAFVFVK
jgi:hypothetical protein